MNFGFNTHQETVDTEPADEDLLLAYIFRRIQ